MSATRRHKPIVGLSACLTGQNVRYDAGHKQQPMLLSLLAPHVQLRPFCPEVEAGLGVPRPAVQLIASSKGQVRARGVDDPSLDVSDALASTAMAYCREQLPPLSGFVFKSRSPSCGLGSTPLRDSHGEVVRYSSGLFAEQVKESAPWLPCVEEGWLAVAANGYRFLSACAVTACYRHHDEGYGDLLAMLEPELQLKGNALVDALLGDATRVDKSRRAEGDKAALWERLSDYWQGKDQA